MCPQHISLYHVSAFSVFASLFAFCSCLVGFRGVFFFFCPQDKQQYYLIAHSIISRHCATYFFSPVSYKTLRPMEHSRSTCMYQPGTAAVSWSEVLLLFIHHIAGGRNTHIHTIFVSPISENKSLFTIRLFDCVRLRRLVYFHVT